jgi:ribosomal protein L29
MNLKEIVKSDLEELQERRDKLEKELFYIKNEIKLKTLLK